MSETLCAEPLVRQSDFFAEGGQWINGACGPTALAAAATSATGHVITPQSVYDLMRQHGLCDPDGASTIGGLQQAAVLLGCEVASFPGYQEPWTEWGTWLVGEISQGHPVVLEWAFAQALVDSISGQGENYVDSLDYHYGAVLGMNSGGSSALTSTPLMPGFWCADGDNWAGGNGVSNDFHCTQQLQYYPDAIMAAARPCAGLSLKGGRTMGVPPGWTDSENGDVTKPAGILTAPNGLTVSSGFRYRILTTPGWPAENVPLELAHFQQQADPSDPSSTPGSSQLFAYVVLVWLEAPAPGGTIRVVPAGKILQQRGGTNPPPDPSDTKLVALKAKITADLEAF